MPLKPLASNVFLPHPYRAMWGAARLWWPSWRCWRRLVRATRALLWWACCTLGGMGRLLSLR